MICKDFLKGNCDRKGSCKFRHTGGDAPEKVPFCKDFANADCTYEAKQGRECSYMHADKWTVHEYEITGWLPEEVVKQVADRYKLCFDNLKGACERSVDSRGCRFSHTVCGMDLRNSGGKQPVQLVGEGWDIIVKRYGLCRDYTDGGCTLGNDCKFKHREPMDVNLGNANTTWAEVRKREMARAGQEVEIDRRASRMKRRGEDRDDRDMASKRMRTNGMPFGGNNLQDENEMLTMENAQLKQKVMELMAANKFLLQQNAVMQNCGMQQQMPMKKQMQMSMQGPSGDDDGGMQGMHQQMGEYGSMGRPERNGGNSLGFGRGGGSRSLAGRLGPRGAWSE